MHPQSTASTALFLIPPGQHSPLLGWERIRPRQDYRRQLLNPRHALGGGNDEGARAPSIAGVDGTKTKKQTPVRFEPLYYRFDAS